MDERAPTLEDVARVAGVSRATVSRVVNHERRVAADLQAKVFAAVAEVGYVPNRAARSLVTRRTDTVAVVISGTDPKDAPDQFGAMLSDPFFGRVVGGAIRELRPRDVHPVLMLADAVRTRQQVVSFVSRGHVDGTLLVPLSGDDPLPEALLATGRPLVRFARPRHRSRVSWVDVANADGGALAAGHLVDRGRRRLAVLGLPERLQVAAAAERVEGFVEAAVERGAEVLGRADGEFTVESGAAAARRVLDDHPRVDGLFAANDLMAIGAVRAARERGLGVPEDLAVVGFDDSPAAALAHPALTTVRQPVEDMASEMARLLLDQIADRSPVQRTSVLEPTLVVREST
ncbi:LacI family DNA-binding transcriptional regulator [Phycicoccus sp. CSK15P-2]|uniref:LacI family DNA-binding transcriptional regulator n=1 Tax=Phycicoccus sp. CSK15P-2 TaxID=2807627 RepID=UPI001950C04B|nr:LacI family DNA-binding transcriptional regulator [Phycicoccus sp. CSK15P-2]MBM6404528.1 LacI family DNA-binding transcriptional regulator [Phycicoccus sp. CSK15P-2]